MFKDSKVYFTGHAGFLGVALLKKQEDKENLYERYIRKKNTTA